MTPAIPPAFRSRTTLPPPGHHWARQEPKWWRRLNKHKRRRACPKGIRKIQAGNRIPTRIIQGSTMNTAEIIYREAQALPEDQAREVLAFLKAKRSSNAAKTKPPTRCGNRRMPGACSRRRKTSGPGPTSRRGSYCRTVSFENQGWEGYPYRHQTGEAGSKRINQSIRDILRDPSDGIGKPEPSCHPPGGPWSRRIEDEHRLVYAVKDGNIVIAQCRHHHYRFQ